MSVLHAIYLIIIGIESLLLFIFYKIIKSFTAKYNEEAIKRINETKSNAALLEELESKQQTILELQKKIIETKKTEVSESSEKKNKTAKEKAASVGFRKAE